MADQGRDEAISMFCSIASCDPATAEHMLDAHGWDLEQSINFYLEDGAGAPPTAAFPYHSESLEVNDDEPVVVDRPGSVVGEAGAGQASLAIPRIVDSHEPVPAYDLTNDNNAIEQQFQEPALTFGAARRRRTSEQEVQVLDEGDSEDLEADEDDIAVLARHRANRVSRDDDLEVDERPAPSNPFRFTPQYTMPGGARTRRGGPTAAGLTQDMFDSVHANGNGYGNGGPFGPGRYGAGTGVEVEGDEDEDMVGRGDAAPDLPEGINVEEARMLEAAMLGVAYQGHIPDFATQRPPAPVDPVVQRVRSLREEQDMAYEESLRADREKREAAERARAAQEEAAREQQRVEAQAAAAEEQRRAAYERTISGKEASLPAEPGEEEGGAVTVLVRLPEGGRCSRRFRGSDPLAALFDFVDVSQKGSGLVPGSYRLVSTFPRRVFEEDRGGSLADAGLDHRNEALMLEMKD